MVSSSQASRVRAEKRTLLERRPRFGPRHNRANALRLPLPLPMAVSELIADYGEGASHADPALRKGAPEKAPWEADRSVHAPFIAAEGDDDVDLLILGRPAVERKKVLQLTDSKGVEVGVTATNKGVPVATSAPVQKPNHGLVEVKVDSAAARGLVLPKVEADKEAASLKASSAHEKSIEAQIDLLENQVAIGLKFGGGSSKL